MAPQAERRTYLTVVFGGAGACFSRQAHVLQAKPVAKKLALAHRVSVSYFASSALLAECPISYLSVKALRAEGPVLI
jgi:hypothetical protein